MNKVSHFMVPDDSNAIIIVFYKSCSYAMLNSLNDLAKDYCMMV